MMFLVAACRGPAPGLLAGESDHFRLYVDPALVQPDSAQVASDLATLETDWADKAALVSTPAGKIDYHLLTAEHITEACAFAEFAQQGAIETGCEWWETLEIDAGYLPHQHELIHAYMAQLAPGRRPIPLLTEGTAEAIGCFAPILTDGSYEVPWAQAVVSVPTESDLVYYEGGRLARYLIRTQGWDAFLRYYRQAPGIRDPGLFAANFSAFWNTSIDEVWRAMHTVAAGDALNDAAICPCSLPTLPEDGAAAPADATNPYWTLPNLTGGQTIALSAPATQDIVIQDCPGVHPLIQSYVGGGDAGNVLLANLASTAGLYAGGGLDGAIVGGYLSNSCAATTPYPFPAGLLTGTGELVVVASRTTTGAMTEYLQIQAPTPMHLTFGSQEEVCDTCAFDQGSCQPPSGVQSTVGVQGTAYVRFTFFPLQPDDPNPDVVEATLAFSN